MKLRPQPLHLLLHLPLHLVLLRFRFGLGGLQAGDARVVVLGGLKVAINIVSPDKQG